MLIYRFCEYNSHATRVVLIDQDNMILLSQVPVYFNSVTIDHHLAIVMKFYLGDSREKGNTR